MSRPDVDAYLHQVLTLKAEELGPLVRTGTLTPDEAWLAASGGADDEEGLALREYFERACRGETP